MRQCTAIFNNDVFFSVTIGLKGGCYSLPFASAILLFPPQVVQEEVSLTFSRIRHEECEEKPKDGEAFVSRILKIEPEGVKFRTPVTVLLSHSACERQDIACYYELVVENLSQAGRQELKTERISSIEGIGNKETRALLITTFVGECFSITMKNFISLVSESCSFCYESL